MLWGCSATSAVSVLPCTGGRTAEHALWLSATSAVSVLPCTGGRTAEHALGLFSYQCCVRAALYRGQDCRTCSGVVQLPVLCPCCLVQGAGLQNMLWGCSAITAASMLPCTGGRTAEHALWFAGLSHMGSGFFGPVSPGVYGPVSHGLWGLWACLEKAVHCVFHTKVRQVGLQSNLYQKNRNLAI